MDLDPIAVAAFEQAYNNPQIVMARGDAASSQQRRAEFLATQPSRVAEDCDTIKQRGSDGLPRSSAFTLEHRAENPYLEQPGRAVDRMWPAEEGRTTLAHTFLEILHPVLCFD